MADWTVRHVVKALFTPPIVVPPDLFPSCRAGAKGEPAACCMPVTQCLGIRVAELTNILLSNTSAWSRLVTVRSVGRIHLFYNLVFESKSTYLA